MLRKLTLCLVTIVLVATAGSARAGQEPDSTILRAIHHYRDTTWHYQSLMGVKLTPFSVSGGSYAVLRTRWHEHALVAQRRFSTPPHLRDWLCIHHYEGSWTDPNAPYYGGLQMNIGFQSHYGAALLRAKGTADHWTPLEQMWVAEKAYRDGRGFYPWPNTARYCGLI